LDDIYDRYIAIFEEVNSEFWWEDIKERDHLEYLGVDGRIIILK
jgi:hypothetical protein